MALSLQEQLLKAGVADKGAAKKARAEKRKNKKQKQPVDNAAAQAARVSLQAKQAKDRELNQQQNAEKHERSIAAQVKQLIAINKQSRRGGEVLLNFTDDNKIKRMYVNDILHKAVLAGKLAVVRSEQDYELVPIPVADKIAQRSAQTVVYIASENDVSESPTDEEDWYADYEIPDDLTW